MKRAIWMATLLALLVAMIACDSDPRPQATATLLNNEEVHQAFLALDSAVANLQGNVAQFDTENWREVVPEVRGAASNVESASAQLRKALGYSPR
jgi:hypothetical protein